MKIRKAERRMSKIKIALQGPAGCGKTYSALLLAKGITNDLSRVCVLDTENGSSDLYAHLGEYSVLNLNSPFSPEKYCQAIEIAYKEGFSAIIIDSISQCWEYLLDYHSNLAGNSFTNWSRVTPRHNAFIQAILNTPVHIIATVRTKQDYVLNQKSDGKYVPEKVGLKGIQRDGMDYEFTLVFDLDIKHNANCSKDRTGLFMDQPAFKISVETGKKIMEWCSKGISVESVKERKDKAQSLKELMELYKSHNDSFPDLREYFTLRKQEILTNYV